MSLELIKIKESFSFGNWFSYSLVCGCLSFAFLEIFENLDIPRLTAMNIIAAIHNNFINKFQKQIWNSHSYNKGLWEHAMNITSKLKKSSRPKDSLQKEKDMLTIVTNNKHIIKKYDKPYLINSDWPMMNTKYRISKYLTSVFCGLPIDIETRNKYFLRIRQLLLDKLVVIVTPTPSPQNVFKDFSKIKQINKQFKTPKEQEKYKKRFKTTLRLKRRGDILKKQYISEKEMEFLVDQVTSKVGYKILIDDIL
ncbi:hypothetical protein RhiirC2_791233 [Rhizophagus irregularis]|uniref:Uncharacterized protein n=1 Tax=Rhizophagus irregularis TaxID=588596 RepID=A0A2N1MJM0_9GLOM|nr:hypothetical protein RhiirC2_791233 [Rhizophagus irregularis]